MTEKRFTIDKDGITIIDNYTGGLTECKYSNEAKLLCNFLNEVVDENEQLKQVANDFAENPTQHNLWKLRTILKGGDVE